MITPSDNVFPNNIVELVALRTELLDSDLFVVKRPLRPTDPNQSVGITAVQWQPNERSREMLGATFAVQPTLSRYAVTVQAFIKDMDEVRGLNVHAVLSRMLRSMLYNDNTLRVALSQLSSTLNGATERSQQWGITQQRFLSNELSGEWLYLSILEFWLETETR
jgi:hypothetical protein